MLKLAGGRSLLIGKIAFWTVFDSGVQWCGEGVHANSWCIGTFNSATSVTILDEQKTKNSDQQWFSMEISVKVQLFYFSTRCTSSCSGLPGNIHKKGTQTFKTRITCPLCASFLWGPPTDRKHQWCKAERGYIHSLSSQKKWKKGKNSRAAADSVFFVFFSNGQTVFVNILFKCVRERE